MDEFTKNITSFLVKKGFTKNQIPLVVKAFNLAIIADSKKPEANWDNYLHFQRSSHSSAANLQLDLGANYGMDRYQPPLSFRLAFDAMFKSTLKLVNAAFECCIKAIQFSLLRGKEVFVGNSLYKIKVVGSHNFCTQVNTPDGALEGLLSDAEEKHVFSTNFAKYFN